MKTINLRIKEDFKWICITILYLVVTSFDPNGQGVLIKGKVIDATTKESIVGVNVVVKGTTLGVITDTKGEFKISLPDTTSVLVFSFVGYGTVEKQIGKENSIVIPLVMEKANLQEVVVIGYGSNNKKQKSVAVKSVNSSNFVQDTYSQNYSSQSSILCK